MSSTSFNPPDMSQFRQRALIVGAVFMVILLIGAFLNTNEFFQAYIYAFTFWIGLSIGSLALLMLQHLTGGGWGFVIRRVLEAATRVLPLMAILFIPILLGAHRLYPWTNLEQIANPATRELVQLKTAYLNLPFFVVRAVIYFAVWLLLVYFLNRWSLLQDRTADRRYAKNMRVLSGPGMVLLIFSVTFAAIDWYMSLEPDWSSTIYGFIYVAAWSLSALAFVIAVMALLAKREPMKHIVAPLHFHDHGKLLLALVMLWAYFAFSQFLIIWSGNLPEEIHWYLVRMHGVWGGLIISVALLHFAAPFLFLLSRSLKRDPNKLVIVAGLVLVMRLLDLLWMLQPAFTREHFHISWMHLVAPVAFGGIWLAAFVWQLSKRALVPINDPQFESVLEQAHSHGH
ncbi:MAG TPA: hypothetical protein VKB46_09785 [Pyrinomonadaceae bacterium]|nr:hypothetical protein [Pyrinomonadaceae bacterium]